MKRRNLRLLVAYSMWSNFRPSIQEYLLALKYNTAFDVSYAHVTHDALLDFELNDFDVVFNNYCARFVVEGLTSDSYRRALKGFRGVKIIAVQDEYDNVNRLRAALQEYGFHILLTCIPPEYWPRVYPRSELPALRLVHVLTGYVPENVAAPHGSTIPLKERSTVIGYRGGYLGARYGRLAFEKAEIGRRMREICIARGIPHNIEIDAQSRINGNAWYEFIGSCRSMLGSESGSNVFDFDGSIEQTYVQLTKERGLIPYQEFCTYTDPIEKQFDIGQISPRIFEYAVMRTPMVLFKGHYSGIIEPDKHYIPLEKDFANVDSVLDRLNDFPALEAMAERAYEHLVGSGRFGYRSFARTVAEEILRQHNRIANQSSIGGTVISGNTSLQQKHNQISPLTEAYDEILRELPTPFPRFLSDFQHKQRLLILLKEIEADATSLKLLVQRIPVVGSAARRLWRLMLLRRF